MEKNKTKPNQNKTTNLCLQKWTITIVGWGVDKRGSDGRCVKCLSRINRDKHTKIPILSRPVLRTPEQTSEEREGKIHALQWRKRRPGSCPRRAQCLRQEHGALSRNSREASVSLPQRLNGEA